MPAFAVPNAAPMPVCNQLLLLVSEIEGTRTSEDHLFEDRVLVR